MKFQVNSTFREELFQWWRQTLFPQRQGRRSGDHSGGGGGGCGLEGQEMQNLGNHEIVDKAVDNFDQKTDV